MHNFKAHLMVLSRGVDSKVLRMAIKLSIFIRKRQKGERYVRNFTHLLFGMSSDVPVFKVRLFVVTSSF